MCKFFAELFEDDPFGQFSFFIILPSFMAKDLKFTIIIVWCIFVKMLKSMVIFLSYFPYENFLGQLKKVVRGPRNSLTQVIRRLSKFEEASSNCVIYLQTSKDYESVLHFLITLVS